MEGFLYFLLFFFNTLFNVVVVVVSVLKGRIRDLVIVLEGDASWKSL